MGRAIQLSGLWLLLSLWVCEAAAFGTMGHSIVGYVAEQRMCTATLIKVRDILQGEPLAGAGMWADKIRGYRQYDYAKPWHYMNVPDGVAPQDAPRRPQGDVVWAINEMQSRLNDPGLEGAERVEALRFLVHFVADVHQPLHVGRQSDLGGNKVDVRMSQGEGKRSKKGNLHYYWDSEALNQSVSDPYAFALEHLQRADSDVDLQATDPWAWAAESAALRPVVYDLPAGQPPLLGDAYRARTMDILGDRLVLAGMRLAAVLDATFCTATEAGQGPPGAPENSP